MQLPPNWESQKMELPNAQFVASIKDRQGNFAKVETSICLVTRTAALA
jgi:hypothetical protein